MEEVEGVEGLLQAAHFAAVGTADVVDELAPLRLSEASDEDDAAVEVVEASAMLAASDGCVYSVTTPMLPSAALCFFWALKNLVKIQYFACAYHDFCVKTPLDLFQGLMTLTVII